MIEVTDLVKRYGNHVAVDHISFTIEDGKIYGLLGPNGAGKSTTMNLMTGYLCANEGTITVEGFDIFKQPKEAKKHIGYLPEIPPLYEDMTVREYLRFVCELKNVAREKIEEEIQRITAKTGTEEVLQRLIRNLSKGYKQRIGIAQALAGSPKIIILDEPTVGLDPLQIIEIRELIRELKKEHTVILSSHILSEVSAVCDEILIISKGKLVAKDNAEHLGTLSTGKRELHALIKGDREAVARILDGLTDAPSYELEEKEDLVQVNAGMEEGKDFREELFYALAEQKLPLLEMCVDHASLEEVFIELTGQDEPVPKAEEETADTEASAAGSVAEETDAEETSGKEEVQS
ncbi:MAG: ABC transporter ATP-binding protein [Lachnospiraceae bacterium]|nr:ABC transporter ATP-binding protein [Lachnospiraceae bacterium]